MRHRLLIAMLLLSNAPLSAQQPAEFGSNGYVTRSQLAALEYGPPHGGLALAAHMPKRSLRVGEPAWAFFAVKNLEDKVQGLNMMFNFLKTNRADVYNSCSFTVKPLTPGARAEPSRMLTWACGDSSLMCVDKKGYHVAALDLLAEGKLTPGDYEVFWQYGREQLSNKVRFTVQQGRELPFTEPKARQWSVWEITPPAHVREKPATQPEIWNPAELSLFSPFRLSPALGTGVGDRHVTSLEQLPSRDAWIHVAADWQLGDKLDRVTLRIAANDPKVPINLSHFHVYLLADLPSGASESEPMRSTRWSRQRIVASPWGVELMLPSEWRKPAKGEKVPATFEAALLLTTEPLRELRENMGSLALEVSSAIRPSEPRRWDGMVRTGLQTVPRR